MDTTNDLYQRMTHTILTAMEAGAGTWRMPWHITDAEATHGIALNAVSHTPSRGVNVLVLWVAAAQHDYPTGLWATYAQWQTLGAQVRKDERATHVVFWKGVKAAHKDTEDGEAPEDEGRRRGSIIARDYRIFNAAQVDGYTPPTIPTVPGWQRSTRAEHFFAALGADIRHGGPLAGYAPPTDSIAMPPVGAFRDALGYYATLAHEVTHWTGAPQRLNRDLSTRFGTDAYAAEELIAELGAAFLCADLGLANEPRPDHAAYVASWLRVLQHDKRVIFTAASQAQRVADWVQAQQQTQRAA